LTRLLDSASERHRHVARGQSAAGAATPGEESPFFPKPRRGGSKSVPCRVCCRPSGAWKSFYLSTRGRRFALTPGYMPWPLRGLFLRFWIALAVRSSDRGKLALKANRYGPCHAFRSRFYATGGLTRLVVGGMMMAGNERQLAQTLTSTRSTIRARASTHGVPADSPERTRRARRSIYGRHRFTLPIDGRPELPGRTDGAGRFTSRGRHRRSPTIPSRTPPAMAPPPLLEKADPCGTTEALDSAAVIPPNCQRVEGGADCVPPSR
jgi:hypothetical protein